VTLDETTIADAESATKALGTAAGLPAVTMVGAVAVVDCSTLGDDDEAGTADLSVAVGQSEPSVGNTQPSENGEYCHRKHEDLAHVFTPPL